MTDEVNGLPNSVRIDASKAATSRKINRLPPGEHLVEIRAQAMPNQMVLRIAAYSAELQAGTLSDLDKIFGQSPTDARAKRAYEAQGSFWMSLILACGLGLGDDELQDISLPELAEKISGRQAIAVINDAGYWSRVRPI